MSSAIRFSLGLALATLSGLAVYICYIVETFKAREHLRIAEQLVRSVWEFLPVAGLAVAILASIAGVVGGLWLMSKGLCGQDSKASSSPTVCSRASDRPAGVFSWQAGELSCKS